MKYQQHKVLAALNSLISQHEGQTRPDLRKSVFYPLSVHIIIRESILTFYFKYLYLLHGVNLKSLSN